MSDLRTMFTVGDVVGYSQNGSVGVITEIAECSINVRWDWGQESTVLDCLARGMLVFGRVTNDVANQAGEPGGTFTWVQ